MKNINSFINERLNSTGTKNSNSLLNASDFSWVIDKKESSRESKAADSLVNNMANDNSLGNEFYDYIIWDDKRISEKRLNEFRNLEKHYSWRRGKSFDGHVEESKVKEYVNKQKEKGLIAVNVDSGSDYSFYLLKKKKSNEKRNDKKVENVKHKRKSSWRKDLEKLQDNDDVLNKYMKDNNWKNSNEMLASLSPEKRKSLIDKVMADIMKDI